ncbi:MAG: glycogen phosphorylase [Patescibacteria group bacterium]|nr:glycogen phosphorylase [Patescibacteria group bacterium]
MNNTKEEKFKIAYFSMEIGMHPDIKTYSGGLGVLAGDILRSAADLKVPLIGVTLLNRYGYFNQEINKQGEQKENLFKAYSFSKLKKLKTEVSIKINKDKVYITAWEYSIKSPNGFIVPVVLLDTNLRKNKKKYRTLTDHLYGGDKKYRLLQEMILGRGGYEMIKKLGYCIKKFHINEGHGSFVTIAKFLDEKGSIRKRLANVKKACVFTTHTPLKTANDIFSVEKVKYYQPDFPDKLPGLVINKKVNMTEVALYFSNYVNGVSNSHQKVTREMFPRHFISNVTNGVHSLTWTAPEFVALFDEYIPTWRESGLSLRHAFSIPLNKIWTAHQSAKRRLLKTIEKKTGEKLEINVFTIGFARRFTAYKRPTLLFNDIEKLLKINDKIGKIQLVYSGKAHPQDEIGKSLIKELNEIKKNYGNRLKIVFLENYDMKLAKLITAGVDIWLNNPLPPNEASGTSGMKAAHNGIPQLSTLDGWWHEGYIKAKTGWAIAHSGKTNNKKQDEKDANCIYNLLTEEILPTFYHKPEMWREIMRFSIAINASYFNTDRVVRDYIQNAYFN